MVFKKKLKVVKCKNFMNDARHTSHEGRIPIAISHLSETGDQKMKICNVVKNTQNKRLRVIALTKIYELKININRINFTFLIISYLLYLE